MSIYETLHILELPDILFHLSPRTLPTSVNAIPGLLFLTFCKKESRMSYTSAINRKYIAGEVYIYIYINIREAHACKTTNSHNSVK